MTDHDGQMDTPLTQQSVGRWLAYSQAQADRVLVHNQALRSRQFEYEAIRQELLWRQAHPFHGGLKQAF